jgi:hypothetical protein|tara:strand:- start:4562 stop:4822 length:261 start_codon:yes stop_codon:yes gene_type:complete
MKINLHIDYVGGVSRDVTANAADMVAFEDKYSISIAHLSSDPRMSYLLFLCWHAEKRTGATKEAFEKWCESIEQVGAADTDPKSKG